MSGFIEPWTLAASIFIAGKDGAATVRVWKGDERVHEKINAGARGRLIAHSLRRDVGRQQQ